MAAFLTHSLLFFPLFSFILILLYISLSICIPAVGSMPVYPQKSVILAFDTALVGNSIYQIFFSVEKYQKTGHHVDRSHGECQSDLSGIDLA